MATAKRGAYPPAAEARNEKAGDPLLDCGPLAVQAAALSDLRERREMMMDYQPHVAWRVDSEGRITYFIHTGPGKTTIPAGPTLASPVRIEDVAAALPSFERLRDALNGAAPGQAMESRHRGRRDRAVGWPGHMGPGLDQIPGAGEAYRELAIELAPVAKAVLRRHPGPV